MSGTTPTPSGLKALEVLFQANQIFLALAGACLAYLLHHGKDIRAFLNRPGRLVSKIVIFLSFPSQILVGGLYLWDLKTFSNQLRNDILVFDDFIGETFYLKVVITALVSFVYSAWVISGDETKC